MIGERRWSATQRVDEHRLRPENATRTAMLRKTAPVFASSQSADPASQGGLNLGDSN